MRQDGKKTTSSEKRKKERDERGRGWCGQMEVEKK